MFKRVIIPVFFAGIWISFSEFLRNELLFNHIWQEHYQSLGLKFPSEPENAALWVLWSFYFAFTIYLISRKNNFKDTVYISWLAAFFLMWLVTWNMAVLPFKILIYATPLSFLETIVATWIIKKLSNSSSTLESKPI